MGVRLSKWVTMHGFALNSNPNMNYYDGMIPCGIFEYGVTSIQKLIDTNLSVYEMAISVASHCDKFFNEYKVMEKNEI